MIMKRNTSLAQVRLSIESKKTFTLKTFSVGHQATLSILNIVGAEYTISDDGSSGENYPGISLYHDGMDLVVIVSTGDDVWKLQVGYGK